MPIPTSYTELQAELVEWLKRDDLAERVTTFIAMAEARLNRVLLTAEREAVATTTLSAATLELPEDYWGLRAVYLDTDPKCVLEQKSLADLRNTYSAGMTGKPQHFAIQSGNVLVMGPAPDSSYSIVINYWQTIPALTENNADNWLLLAYPDLYMHGALVHAEAFMVNDPRIGIWKNQFEEGLIEAMRVGQRKTNSAGPQRIRSPIVV